MNKTTKPAALAGIEPVAGVVQEYTGGTLALIRNKNTVKVGDVLYSAATVEQLVRERDGWIDSAREFSTGMEYYRDQLDACARHIGLPCFTADDGGVHEEPLRAKVAEEVERLVQERDKCIKECNEFWGKRSDQDFELICALQAREQQLREALEICKKEMQGDKWDALYIDGVLANHSPEDDIEQARRKT